MGSRLAPVRKTPAVRHLVTQTPVSPLHRLDSAITSPQDGACLRFVPPARKDDVLRWLRQDYARGGCIATQGKRSVTTISAAFCPPPAHAFVVRYPVRFSAA